MQRVALLVLVLCVGVSVGVHRREHRRYHRHHGPTPPPPDDRYSARYETEDGDFPYTGSYDVLPDTDLALIGIAPTQTDDDDVVVATVTPDGDSGVFVGRPSRRGGRRGHPRWGPPPPDRKMVAVLRRMKWRIGEMMQELGDKIEDLEKRGKPEFTVRCDCGGNGYQPPAVIRLTSEQQTQTEDGEE